MFERLAIQVIYGKDGTVIALGYCLSCSITNANFLSHEANFVKLAASVSLTPKAFFFLQGVTANVMCSVLRRVNDGQITLFQLLPHFE